MHALLLCRVYEAGDAPPDARRILVDRLWPRGIRKDILRPGDRWEKDVAPTPALRTWFGHDPARFGEFSRRYRAELAANPAAATLARDVEDALRDGGVCLLYAARDPVRNHAAVLRDWLVAAAGKRG
ncbi:MAG: DUF488 family protein [Kiritimatiellae bacterium]|nr:DUF488 family protein [Kiritimatiellia bacterium]